MSAVRAIEQFMSTPLQERLARERQLTAQSRLQELFQRTAQDVPAYREFLAAHRIDPSTIKTYADFEKLPLVTKQNYVHRYPRPARCGGGNLTDCEMIAVSSGSTGKPLFWPRSLTHELDVATRFEQVFVQSFGADRRTTLVVICFALGTWVGGMYTA